ncbi:MAG: hypothetical protein AB7S92_00875 [Parvibaculaceae bacterium]
MQDIFVQSQWDTILAFVKQGHPPLWVLLCAVNGGFVAFWICMRMVKDRPLRPASVTLLRVLFVILNVAAIFRDDTLRLVRPFLRYFT